MTWGEFLLLFLPADALALEEDEEGARHPRALALAPPSSSSCVSSLSRLSRAELEEEATALWRDRRALLQALRQQEAATGAVVRAFLCVCMYTYMPTHNHGSDGFNLSTP